MCKIPIVLSILSVFAFYPALAANWDDPNVNLVQSISDRSFRDANTGQIVGTRGMPDELRNPMAAATAAQPIISSVPDKPDTAIKPEQPDIKPDIKPGTTETAATAATSKLKNKGWSGMSNTGKAASVVGAVAGTAGLISSAAGKGEHGATNMITGIGSGITAGCSIGSMIPGYGTLIGCALGLAAGVAVPGSQLLSETDCIHDPVTGKFTCCNTAFNKGERQVEIGGYMFCSIEENGQIVGKYGVRQCLQGGSDKPASWWDGLWKDDAWSPECVIRYCNGEPPADTAVDIYADTENFCYNWRLAAPTAGSSVPDAYTLTIQKIQTQIQELQKQCGNLLQ